MEVHAEYFLKCSAAAKWLNTPQPVTGVPKEFLDGAHAMTSSIEGVCRRESSTPRPAGCEVASSPCSRSLRDSAAASARGSASADASACGARRRSCRHSAAASRTASRNAHAAHSPLAERSDSGSPSDGAYERTSDGSSGDAFASASPSASASASARRSVRTCHSPGCSGTSSCYRSADLRASSAAGKAVRRSNKGKLESDVDSLQRGFPCLEQLGSGAQFGAKSLLYVPVELYDHFVFGVVLGCPVPPPDGVAAEDWTPLVTRFVLDAGRKCCLMFSYFAEGSIVVSVDCFDEVGDHFSEITFFEPTPVVGVFPRGIRGRMQIFEKRDCPNCTTACLSCCCPMNERVEAIVKLRQARLFAPERGPAHAGSTYKDDNVLIQTYPYWAQVLDEYKWSRVGSYCVQIQYTPAVTTPSKAPHAPRTLAYRASVRSEPRVTIDKMLRVGLFDKGVSALKPPATDVRWETSSTIAVNSNNAVVADADPVKALCFLDWHKLPGFQEDYLLVAPSNIVSSAHARAELARAEAERLAAQARVGVPVIPTWASGRAGVFEHILQESELRSDPTLPSDRDPIQLNHFPPAPVSAGTVMHPRTSLDSTGDRGGHPERTFVDHSPNPRPAATTTSAANSPRGSLDDSNRPRQLFQADVSESNRKRRRRGTSSAHQ